LDALEDWGVLLGRGDAIGGDYEGWRVPVLARVLSLSWYETCKEPASAVWGSLRKEYSEKKRRGDLL